MTRFKTTIGLTLVSLLLACTPAGAANATAGGAIKMFASPGAGAGGKVTFTGAVGDYGTLLSTDKSGKPRPDAGYLKITLQKGGFRMNVAAFTRKMQHSRARIDFATCSASVSVSAPISVYDGSGLYKGIRGKLRITGRFGIIGRRLSTGPRKGLCDHNDNAEPIEVYRSVIGGGKVTFG